MSFLLVLMIVQLNQICEELPWSRRYAQLIWIEAKAIENLTIKGSSPNFASNINQI